MDTFYTYSNEKPILDLEEAQKYNGRINIIQPPDIHKKFGMTEKIPIEHKSTDYRNAVKGDLEKNTLNTLFFSKENIQMLQNGIRVGVYEKSNQKYILSNQNENNLKIIMRNIYMDYAAYNPNTITQEIEKLNKLVLDYCVPMVYNESIAYEKYCYDQSTIVRPLELPKNHDRNFKQLELKPYF